MKKNIYVIIDVSGSMHELGKIFIQQNLLCSMLKLENMDERYNDTSIHYYKWSDNIDQIDTKITDVIPLHACGTLDLMELYNFICDRNNPFEKQSFLVLSDGLFHSKEFTQLKKNIDQLENIILEFVAVGIDANIDMLKKISTTNTCYLAEDIVTALEKICTKKKSDSVDVQTIDQIH